MFRSSGGGESPTSMWNSQLLLNLLFRIVGPNFSTTEIGTVQICFCVCDKKKYWRPSRAGGCDANPTCQLASGVLERIYKMGGAGGMIICSLISAEMVFSFILMIDFCFASQEELKRLENTLDQVHDAKYAVQK